MAKMQQKGKTGAAKSYMTRPRAVRKLQISLADFRRLCILKGIFPVEPPSRKKANKGNPAPVSFYFTKDIIYLQHEPVLKKLREHKAFAKKLARAVGRQEWFNAKSLEEQEPKYRLDHIIKERYPTFIDALRDIDDALCLVTLFSLLPANDKISPAVIDNCARLSAEWQLYVMRTRTLRKVFLSIKGIYFQAEVMGQPITWLVPYLFTQHVPADVDFRIMLTFLELYQTLLGFVLFKLYTDINLVYPPPLDKEKEAQGAGVGAFTLQETADALPIAAEQAVPSAETVSVRDVKKAIQNISAESGPQEPEEPTAAEPMQEDTEEVFVEQPSKTAPVAEDGEPDTLSLPTVVNTSLFAPFTIFISREVTRSVFEFIIRCFGGRVGWAPNHGVGSPFLDTDLAITHVVMDRPTLPETAIRQGRKYVQPQWVVDSVNKGVICTEGLYAPGETLPPHLSPFVDNEKLREQGGYVPDEVDGAAPEDVAMEDIEGAESDEDEDEDEEDEEPLVEDEHEDATQKVNKSKETATPAPSRPALQLAASNPTDPALVRAAEMEAEAAGISYAAFQSELKVAVKKASKGKPQKKVDEEEAGMAKIMMSSKKRKLYEAMKKGNKKREDERVLLERKKEQIRREGKKAKS